MVAWRRKRHAERLGRVVEALPFETQKAMLRGLERYERIIAGAYSDRNGGVCPMLAAHRCGGRTDFKTFARAWDSFTGAKRRSRPATKRELVTLRAQLEVALAREEERRTAARRERQVAEQRHPDTVKASRRKRPLRVWLGPFRRWDRYRETVAQVSAELERAGLLDVEGEEMEPTPDEREPTLR